MTAPGDVPARRVVEIPAGLELERTPRAANESDPYRSAAERADDLSIVWRARGGKHLKLAAFVLLWNLIIWMFMVMTIFVVDAWFMAAFGALFVVVGFGMIYWVAGLFVNRTRLRIEGEVLSVRSSPLPLRKPRQLLAAEVQQVFVVQTAPYHVNGVEVLAFSVRARMRSTSAEVDLVPNMETPEQALWVEAQLEDCLALEDHAVQGAIEAGAGRPAFVQPWDGPNTV